MDTIKPRKTEGRPGRPRAFNEDRALQQAMEVFWRKGYDATSLADLTAAMKINPPSLYAAFGNKEALFMKVLARYGQGPASYVMEALAAPSAREVAERRLYGTVEALTRADCPPGCLVVQAATKCGDAADPIAQKMITLLQRTHGAFADRFKRAQAEGDLPNGTDPEGLARFLDAVAQGMAIQSGSGAGRAELLSIAEIALRLWPE